jgi:hypothetical protein
MGGGRSSGFTSAEMLLVLLVLALAGGLLFAVLGRVRQQRAAGRFIADLQAFAPAFQAYHQQRLAWPPTTNRDGGLPRELDAALMDTNWDNGSPFGGSYGWDGRGAVVLTAFAPSFPLDLTRDDLLAIDRRMDDGDLATGRLRTGFNGWPVYFVEETP